MTNISKALAVSLLSGAFLLTAQGAYAQSNATPPTSATGYPRDRYVARDPTASGLRG